MPDRLQKIIAAAGVGSRRKAEEWILEGRVSVDGEVVSNLGAKADPTSQRIELNGRLIPPPPQKRMYIALHKPKGYASTLADAHAGHLITELIALPGKPMLRPVGRLDIDTEGLIFLTDDGDFIYHLSHPKFEVEKQYLVTVRGAPTPNDIERLVEGIRIDDGTMAHADRARLVGTFAASQTADIELVLHQGRNRIVRRMCSALGLQVARLIRNRIGFVTIGSIPSGGWRHLTASEVKRLMTASNINSASGRSEPGRPGHFSNSAKPGISASGRTTYRRTTKSISSRKSQHTASGEKNVNSKNIN